MSNTIIIHSLAHAEAALSAAADQGLKVTLLSPPGAAAYMGATVFRDMIAAAAAAHPQAAYSAVLDCGDDPGLALGAMRHGISGVRIHNGPEIRAKLADIAEQRGVHVYDDENAGEVLDLDGIDDATATCRAWLEGVA